MDDKKKDEQKKEEPTPDRLGEGVDAKTNTDIDRAEAANERKAELLKEEQALQDRKESLYAKQLIGGRAEAGGEPVDKDAGLTEEQKDTSYAEKLMKGEVDPLKDDGFKQE